MESEMIMLSCGHNYTKNSWKESDTCWFCAKIRTSNKCNSQEHRAWKGLVVAKSSGKWRLRTIKEALERDRLYGLKTEGGPN